MTIVNKPGACSKQAVNATARGILRYCEQNRSTSTHHSASLPGPDSAPVPPVQFEDITPVEYALHKLRWQRLEEAQLPVYIPPMAKANLQARDDDLFPLMEKVQEFLDSERQVMLILGDSGAGKSTFNLHLEHQLWTAYQNNDPIPLFVNLPAIDRPNKELIVEHLRAHNFTDDQIQEMKHRRQFILICDGYDESQLTVNLHTTNLFNRPGQWDVKLVISCRTQYLVQDYRGRFMPDGVSHYTSLALDRFQEAVLAPFSKKQIENYVDQYVPLEPRTWTTKDYMDKLTTVSNLLDLVRNPFLLSLSLEALPEVTEEGKDLSTIKITRVQLYDTFVRHWLAVNSRRLQRSVLSKEDRSVLDQLLDAGFVSMGIDYSTRLAAAIFKHQDGNPVVQYVHLMDKSSWRAEFFRLDPGIRMLRDSSPIARTGNLYRFVHRSMLEYFLSCAVFDPSNHGDNGQPPCHSDTDTTTAARPLDTEGLLFKRNLLSEPSVIQFLCERVEQNLEFKTQLHAIIEQSKSDTTATTAATNAITILVRAGVRFNSADLRGIRIPGADLSDGQFDSVLFQGADLTGANFSRSWLRQANFSSAQMEGVRFGELPFLKGEDDCIISCAFSPEGEMFAVGLKTGNIDMYDTTTWTKIHGLGRRKQDVCNVDLSHLCQYNIIAFSPNSENIVSTDGKSLRLWDIARGETIHLMEGHTELVTSVVFSPCGKQIASSSDDGTVRLWSSETGKEMFFLKGHTYVINVIKYAPDGRRLVSGGWDGMVRFWDPETGNPGPACSGSLGVVSSLDYSPNGRRVASGYRGGDICLWDADSGDLALSFDTILGDVLCIAFSPDGQWIVSSGNEPIVLMFDSSTGLLVSTFSGHTNLVDFCAFSPNGLQIASKDAGGIVRLWDAKSRTPTPPDSNGITGGVSTVSYSIDGRSVLSCIPSESIQRWNTLTGASEPIAIKKMGDKVRSFASSPDGRQIATGYDSGALQLWDGQAETVEQTLIQDSRRANMLMYSPCGRWILSAHWNSIVRLWDLHDAAGQSHVICQFDLAWFGSILRTRVAFSPVGNQFVVGTNVGRIQFFDPLSENPCIPIKEMTCGSVRSLAYSPDGQRLVFGMDSGALCIWDLQSETTDVDLKGHGSGVSCVTYSPCGRWLLSGSKDRTIRIWRLRAGGVDSWSCVAVVRGCSQSINCLAWNLVVPMEFVSGCDDGSVRVWKISIGDDGGVETVRMLWGNNVGLLCVSGLTFKGAVGLSPISQRLLNQRGAVDDAFCPR